MTVAEKPLVETDIGRELGVLLRAYRERVAPLLAAFPQGTRGYQALAEVVRGGHPSQLALANHLGIDRTVMTYLVDDLEKDGLVERRANPEDRRQRQVVATPKGLRAVTETCQKVRDAEDGTLALLSRKERTALRSLLSKATAFSADPLDDPCAGELRG